MDDPNANRRTRKSVSYLRSKALHWRLESRRQNGSPSSLCLALAEQFDAKADAAAACSAKLDALELALNVLNVLACDGTTESTDDRTERIARTVAQMNELLRELDGLNLRAAAAHLSMALETARAALPQLNS